MHEDVRSALAQARALGFLGPGSLGAHDASAGLFLDALGTIESPALDLGSGGGVPGLLLAAADTSVSWVLLDANRRRTSFLASAVAALGWGSRVTVVRERAEIAAHDGRLRERFAVVVSRSFAVPQMTAECAAGFVRVGGRLAVADPPEGGSARWDATALRRVGLLLSEGQAPSISVFSKTAPLDGVYPRSSKAQARSPLW